MLLIPAVCRYLLNRGAFYSSASRRHYSKLMEECRKLYVKYHKDEQLMRISFVHSVSPTQAKELKFLRCKDEKLESTLQRMKSKIESASLPKQRRKSKRKEISSDVNAEATSVTLKVIHCNKELEGCVPNIVAWIQGSQFKVNDLVYDIVVNGPEVSYLKLPKAVMSGFIMYPVVCLESASKKDSMFTWYRSIPSSEVSLYSNDLVTPSKTGEHWLRVGEGFFYNVSNDDVGHKLKVVCLPRLEGRCGRQEEAVSVNPVVRGPDKCPFEDRHEFTTMLSSVGNIRFVSYNILADLYAETEVAQNYLFAHCPSEYLDYEYRKQLYVKELLGYNGDILCLQEVDRKVFNHDLLPILSAAGFEGVYSEKGGQVVEGLACFFRSAKFRLIHSEAAILSEVVKTDFVFGQIYQKLSENEKLLERFGNRTTALQVTLLESLDIPERRILVGNTHLYFHPDSDNIRLIQAYVCIKYLEQILRRCWEEKPEARASLIFSGDFNSCPEFGVFQLMTEGGVNATCTDWKSNEEEAVDGVHLSHSLLLASACGTPSYTNYTPGFVGCLDYIFYDTDGFTVKDIVPLPRHEQVTEHSALPNVVFPSDHLALVCTLQINTS